MTDEELRTKLREEVQAVDAATLVPHHRRGALLILAQRVDLVDTAVAIGADNADLVGKLIDQGMLSRPSLGQIADWCVDLELRFQFVIVQPYVLAQVLPRQRSAAELN